jgi:hypothetical protein
MSGFAIIIEDAANSTPVILRKLRCMHPDLFWWLFKIISSFPKVIKKIFCTTSTYSSSALHGLFFAVSSPALDGSGLLG